MGAKESVCNWWILALLALFLWYRNIRFDRVIALFIFTLGIIQLIEYAVYCGASGKQAGAALFVTLWLQILILAICVFVFVKNANNNSTEPHKLIESVAGFMLMIFSVVFVVVLLIALLDYGSFRVVEQWGIREDGSKYTYTEWTHTDGEQRANFLIGHFGWLYIVGLITPFLLLFAFFAWSNVTISALLLYGGLSAVYVLAYYPIGAFPSMWAYLGIGVGFLAWVIGLVPGPNS